MKIRWLLLLAPSIQAVIVDIVNPRNFSVQLDSSGSLLYTLTGGPQIAGCWLMNLKVGSTQFRNVMIDTGSSDLVLPSNHLNAYSGTTYNTDGRFQYGNTVTSGYAGGSQWIGGFFADGINIGGSETNALFAAMFHQTANNLVADGSSTQGIFGLAFDGISRTNVQPRTVFSAFVNAGVFAQNVFAFRGCPATTSTRSYLEFGATDSSLTCGGGDLQWVAITSASYYVVNVVAVYVGGTQVSLPNNWQSDYEGGSIVDSCTTLLLLPTAIFNTFANAILSSGALSKAGMSSSIQNAFLYQYVGVSTAYFKINYAALPTFSITMQGATSGGTVTLTLSGYNYIQGDGHGYVYFPVASTSSSSIILGGTIFQEYYIVFDRSGARVGFGPGCDCASNRNAAVVVSNSIGYNPPPSGNSGGSSGGSSDGTTTGTLSGQSIVVKTSNAQKRYLARRKYHISLVCTLIFVF
ncbi:aspartic peptidase domain-containing protein [Chytriomyces sp. MP71]|nr:aspartic peptidase domain-containing protein [Chytriomyces sp. MP71]